MHNDVDHLRAQLEAARVAVCAMSTGLVGRPMRTDEAIPEACERVCDEITIRLGRLEVSIARLKAASRNAKECMALLSERLARLQEKAPPSPETGRQAMESTPDGAGLTMP